MIKSIIPSVFALCLWAQAASAIEPNILTPEERTAGWKLLFDGKSTAGWLALGGGPFPTKGWTVQDGTLHHEKGGGGGDVVSEESFENFELTWEWKIGQVGNSGVKYNLPDPKKNVGFEFQLLDDAHHPDGIKGGALHQTGGLYDLIAPSADKKINEVGEWNQSRLVVNGTHVEHWVNGGQTVSFEIGSSQLLDAIAKSKYKKIPNFGVKIASPVLLQDHGDEISFRSLKVRVLPPRQ